MLSNLLGWGRPPTLTVAELFDRYQHIYERHRSWPKNERYEFARIKSMFGHHNAHQLTIAQIEEHISQRSRLGRAGKTIAREVGVLRGILRRAQEEGLIARNVAMSVKVDYARNVRLRYLLDHEEPLLRAVAPPDMWRAIQVAIMTGMRLSEQWGLTRADINWESHCIELSQTKNGQPRYIRMSRACERIIREQLDSHEQQHLWPSPQRPTCRVDSSTIAIRMQKLIKAAGIPHGLTWHCLRHTAATRMIRGGVDVRTIQEVLGHSSADMTMRYCKVCPEHTARAVEALADWSERLHGTT